MSISAFITRHAILPGQIFMRIARQINTEKLCNTAYCLSAQSTSIIRQIKASMKEYSVVPKIPQQKVMKPTLVFDFNGFISSDRFSFRRFEFVSYKRPYCEEMLYGLVGNYEMINVSDVPSTQSFPLLSRLDPFGCIAYRLSVRNKKDFLPCHLNRPLEKTIVIATNCDEFNPAFKKNMLILPKWTGEEDSALLDVLHFFTSLHFMGPKDVRPTLKTYYNTDFLTTFRHIQHKLYNQRNLFSFESFEKKLGKVNDARIEEYERAKKGMKKLKRQENSKNIYGGVLKFCKGLLL